MPTEKKTLEEKINEDAGKKLFESGEMGALWISEKLNDILLVILFYETLTIGPNMILLIF